MASAKVLSPWPGPFSVRARAVAADEADGLVVGLKRGGELRAGVERVGGLGRCEPNADAVADALDIAQIGDAPAFDQGRIDQDGAPPAALLVQAGEVENLPRHAPARRCCLRPTAALLEG